MFEEMLMDQDEGLFKTKSKTKKSKKTGKKHLIN